MSRKYLVKAIGEDGKLLFTRLVSKMEEAIKEVLNNGLNAKVSWIEFKTHKYTMSDVLRMADRTFKRMRNARYNY